MNTHNLVTMANQIGVFFEAMPDRDEALHGISDHIRRFWAPRMRNEFTTYVEQGGADVSSIVRLAIESYPVLPTPTPFDPDDLPVPRERHRLDGASES